MSSSWGRPPAQPGHTHQSNIQQSLRKYNIASYLPQLNIQLVIEGDNIPKSLSPFEFHY